MRLPAGYCFSASAQNFVIRDYWNLKAPAVLKLSSIEEYGEAFHEVFSEAVRCRLRTIPPIGSTLSGGLDSSAVVCVARKLLTGKTREPIHTVSLLGAHEARSDPAIPCIEEVIRGGGIVSHILTPEESPAYCVNLRQAIIQADDPFDIGEGYFSYIAFRIAKKCGIRVLMDGIDGDLIMPHQHYLAKLFRSMQWITLSSELAHFKKEFGELRLRNLLYHTLVPTMPNVFLGLRRLIGKPAIGSWSPDDIISKEFAYRMDVALRRERRCRTLWKASKDIETLHAWSFSSGLLPFVFESYDRKAGMEGVETRHPFADRRVIEFFLSLPLEMKLFAPREKMVMRAGLKGIVPKRVLWTKRLPFPDLPFLASLLAQHEYLLRDIKASLQSIDRYVNLPKVLQAKSEYSLKGSTEAAQVVWRVVNLAKWLEGKGL